MKNKLHIFILFAAIALCALGQSAMAQNMAGKHDSLYSAVLKEKRRVQVIMPENYKPGSKQKYDVIYVLDGEGNTKTISEIHQFLEWEGMVPPALIVGINNTDRDRDLLPTHTADYKSSGGADKFLSFLTNELIPYVNKKYPSNGENTLFGHSFSALFVLYAMLNEPSAYQSYISADPSLWWDNDWLTKDAKSKLGRLAGLNRTLFISAREGNGLIEMHIPPMDTLLKKSAPAGFTWKLNAYANETHGSVRLKTIYDGLKFTYSGFSAQAPMFHPMSGIMLKDNLIRINYFSDTANARYTLDGTEPMLASPKMPPHLILQRPSKLAVKIISSRKSNDKMTTGDFVQGDYLQSSPKAEGLKPGGLSYTYYEGEWDRLPDFKKLVPVKKGIADSAFNLDKLPRKNNFALLMEGQLEIKEDGYYVFALITDDGSKLYLAGKLLINDDGLHKDEDQGKSYILPLKKGYYPIKLEYFQREGDKSLRLVYVPPANIKSQRPIPIPFSLQYGKQ